MGAWLRRKRSQYKYAKSRCRIGNWPEYEAGLQMLGNRTVWLSDAALNAWRAPASGKPGGQRTYADIALEAALTIRMVFHLPLRQTEGFLRSLAQLLEGLELPIPDHTTLSRQLKKLGEIQFRRLATDRPSHLLIDSTGLRIHVGHLRKPPRRDSQFTLEPSAALQERNRGYALNPGTRQTRLECPLRLQEVQLASKILNTMTRLGMPDSDRVE